MLAVHIELLLPRESQKAWDGKISRAGDNGNMERDTDGGREIGSKLNRQPEQEKDMANLKELSR